MKPRDLLKHVGVHYITSGNTHCRPGWLQVDCPWCELGRGGYHMGINESNLACSCYKCGTRRIGEVLQFYSNLDWSAIRDLLRGVQHQRFARIKHRGKFKEPKGVGPLQPAHKEYLISRRYYPKELVEEWGIGGIANQVKHRWSLYIPFHLNGEVVSYTTRKLHDKGQRYSGASTSDESVPHSNIVYGIDKCITSIIVVEGPFDVWRIGPGAVALLGMKASPAQVEMLSRFPLRAVCFDSTPDAQRNADKLCNLLSVFPGETANVELETGKDSSAADFNEVEDLRRTFLGV